MPDQKAEGQSCLACKKLKRKCDKVLPSCGLCSRTRRPCLYPEDAPPPPAPDSMMSASDQEAAPSAADFAALLDRLSYLESKLATSTPPNSVEPPSTAPTTVSSGSLGGSVMGANPLTLEVDERGSPAETTTRFPAALFVDIQSFRMLGMRLPKRPTSISAEVLSILSQGNAVLEATAEYFSTAHLWMPMISKKRINRGIPLRSGGADMAMLFLAMKLLVSVPSPGEAPEDDHVYIVSKQFVASLESRGMISLPFLQAMTLVALYEFGHAIYPAAWMTVGACARYAEILGLPSAKDIYRTLGPCTNWTEAEERRRLWWGIFILDRAISLGSKRKFSVSMPCETDTLPLKDNSLETGEISGTLQYPVSTPFSTPQPPFARLCQAALLVSRASVLHERRDKDKTALLFSDVNLLADDHLAFVTALDAATPSPPPTTTSTPPQPPPYDRFALLGARCLAWASAFYLLEAFSGPDGILDGPGYEATPGSSRSRDELRLHERADELLDLLCEAVRAETSLHVEQLAGPAASPLTLAALYHAVGIYHCTWREDGDEAVGPGLRQVMQCLQNMANRWRLASEYLALEKFHRSLADTTMSGMECN